MANYTIKNLRNDIESSNENLKDYFFKENPRNGYQAVDLYCKVTGKNLRNIGTGSAKDCAIEVMGTYYELLETQQETK